MSDAIFVLAAVVFIASTTFGAAALFADWIDGNKS